MANYYYYYFLQIGERALCTPPCLVQNKGRIYVNQLNKQTNKVTNCLKLGQGLQIQDVVSAGEEKVFVLCLCACLCVCVCKGQGNSEYRKYTTTKNM